MMPMILNVINFYLSCVRMSLPHLETKNVTLEQSCQGDVCLRKEIKSHCRKRDREGREKEIIGLRNIKILDRESCCRMVGQ